MNLFSALETFNKYNPTTATAQFIANQFTDYIGIPTYKQETTKETIVNKYQETKDAVTNISTGAIIGGLIVGYLILKN